MFDPGLMDMIMRLRGRSISDNNVLRAMEQVPRKYFVEDAQWDKAYDERTLPIACGQSISEPLTVAMMTQFLEAEPEHKLLEVGTGSGYHAAILSRLVRRVYTLERYQSLIAYAEARFRRLDITNIVTRHADGKRGWKGQAPFDRIIVTGGVKTLPKSLIDQLKEDGVCVAVIGGQLSRVTKSALGVDTHKILPLDLPMLETGKSKVL